MKPEDFRRKKIRHVVSCFTVVELWPASGSVSAPAFWTGAHCTFPPELHFYRFALKCVKSQARLWLGVPGESQFTPSGAYCKAPRSSLASVSMCGQSLISGVSWCQVLTRNQIPEWVPNPALRRASQRPARQMLALERRGHAAAHHDALYRRPGPAWCFVAAEVLGARKTRGRRAARAGRVPCHGARPPPTPAAPRRRD